MERKDFIKKFAFGGSILFVAPTLLQSCAIGDDEIFINDIVVDLTDPGFSALTSVGGFTYMKDLIIIRNGDNDYTVLSKVCTHQGCTVSYNPKTNQVPCPCHGSLYSITGEVINGPAPDNLTKYDVRIEGNSLIIS